MHGHCVPHVHLHSFADAPCWRSSAPLHSFPTTRGRQAVRTTTATMQWMWLWMWIWMWMCTTIPTASCGLPSCRELLSSSNHLVSTTMRLGRTRATIRLSGCPAQRLDKRFACTSQPSLAARPACPHRLLARACARTSSKRPPKVASQSSVQQHAGELCRKYNLLGTVGRGLGGAMVLRDQMKSA